MVTAGLLAIAVALGLVIANRMREGQWRAPTGNDLVWLERAAKDALGNRPPPRVIYLHRAGIELRGGPNASHDGRSSVVGAREDERLTVPRFTGGDKRWRQIVACVRGLFAPFDVDVVDQRPSRPGYILVAVGGKSTVITSRHEHTHAGVGGLAPFNGGVIQDAVVFAFSTTLGNRVRPICETIGMEVGHAYGLYHAFECKDVMTYRHGCRKTFVDRDVPCGEGKPRRCHGGAPTQNSYRTLLRLLGAKR
jgi:hypothetical protein